MAFAASHHRSRARLATVVVALTAFGAAYALPAAQTASSAAAEAKVLTVDDYSRWRSIGDESLSDDGRWVTYVLRQSNVPQDETKPVLHVLNLETETDTEVADATSGEFSDDSQWIAYVIDPGGGRGGRGRRGRAGGGAAQGQPGRGGDDDEDEPRRVELRHLESGRVRSWQDIQTFAFADGSRHLMLRRRAARGGGGGGGRTGGGGGQGSGGQNQDAPRGVDLIVHDLTTGRDLLLGSVGDAAFNKGGELLAYYVDAAPKDGNGLFVLDLRGDAIAVRPLDNDAMRYDRLTWNEDGTALAALKGEDVEKMRERRNLLVAFPDVLAALDSEEGAVPVVLDPASAERFPADWVVSDRTALEWSDDGKRVFFGIKKQVPAPNTEDRDPDEEADVDVWHTSDERIQSLQMRRADADRNYTFRQAFDVTAARFVPLADETMRELDVAPKGTWAVGRDTRGYVHDYNRPAADFYRVNTATGERMLMFRGQRTGAGTFGFSPDGGTYLYWQDDRIHAFDLDAGSSRPLAGDDVSFVNLEYDRPGPKPAYGIAGYTKDGTAVVAEHRYDLWVVPLDGARPRNLTGGAGARDEIRFRYVRTEPRESSDGGRGGGAPETIDLAKPVTLSAYGEYTKKAGFYRLTGDELEPLVFEDASFSTPVRAEEAERFLLTRQTFREFPDLRVSGPSFADAKRITDANPQQAEYRWGRRVLFDFENRDGVRLQGILALPDDYQPGERRPMLVTFYEKNSQNLHRYSAPSFLTGMGSSPIQAVSEGYITMLPDIHFRTGASHSDMLECVEAAVRKVIEMGYADPARIGIAGHSYGGEGAAFIGTRSKLFAAVGMGAGVTDLYQDFSQNWGWSYQVDGGSGRNGSDYYLFGQGREAVSPWDDPELYMFESALTHAPEVTAPFLIMHGTADPTVAFFHGLGFYNALRYNGKTAVLLAYPGEGHGLRGHANRKDLTVRFFEFFNHYLKGEPAPKWLAEGVPYLEKEAARPSGGRGGR